MKFHQHRIVWPQHSASDLHLGDMLVLLAALVLLMLA
jgi:hypothetical protein